MEGGDMRMMTTFLHDDHARLDGMLIHFQRLRASDHGAAKAAFLTFKQGLHRHFVWEEAILFPLFEERTGLVEHGPGLVMRLEHRRITACLVSIEKDLQAAHANDRLVQELTQTLAAHDRKEETVLYPWIDAIISPLEGRDLLARMHAVADEPRLDYSRH